MKESLKIHYKTKMFASEDNCIYSLCGREIKQDNFSTDEKNITCKMCKYKKKIQERKQLNH